MASGDDDHIVLEIDKFSSKSTRMISGFRKSLFKDFEAMLGEECGFRQCCVLGEMKSLTGIGAEIFSDGTLGQFHL